MHCVVFIASMQKESITRIMKGWAVLIRVLSTSTVSLITAAYYYHIIFKSKTPCKVDFIYIGLMHFLFQ